MVIRHSDITGYSAAYGHPRPGTRILRVFFIDGQTGRKRDCWLTSFGHTFAFTARYLLWQEYAGHFYTDAERALPYQARLAKSDERATSIMQIYKDLGLTPEEWQQMRCLTPINT